METALNLLPEQKRFVKEFQEFCYNQHDVVVNQKYGDGLPYSFHLKAVVSQAEYFSDKVGDKNNMIFTPEGLLSYEKVVVLCVAAGHDLYEDARLTYNDVYNEIIRMTKPISGDMRPLFVHLPELIAEGIYGCTESTGRDRKERHDDASFQRLVERRFSVYVKLCDIIANLTNSLLTRSRFFEMYKKEWPNVRMKLADYHEVYKPIFDHIDKIVSLD